MAILFVSTWKIPIAWIWRYDLFRRLKAEFPENVGLVVQAYLRRTLDDLKALMDLHTPSVPLNFRICKGIYAGAGPYRLPSATMRSTPISWKISNSCFKTASTRASPPTIGPLVDGALSTYRPVRRAPKQIRISDAYTGSRRSCDAPSSMPDTPCGCMSLTAAIGLDTLPDASRKIQDRQQHRQIDSAAVK
jgi:hypothetical protein